MKKVLVVLIVLGVAGVVVFYVLQSRKETTTDTDTTKTQESADQKDEDSAEGYMDVTAQEAYDLIQDNPNLIIVDVSPNYADGHLPGSVNYYVGDGSLDRAIPDLNPEGMYLVYCHVDSASISGAKILVSAGFTNVYRLEGNYQAWVDAGYEIEM